MKTQTMTLAALVMTACLPPAGATEVTLQLTSQGAISVSLSSPGECASFEGVSVEIGGVPAPMDQVGGAQLDWRSVRCHPAMFTLFGKPAVDLLQAGIGQITVTDERGSRSISVPRRRCVPVSLEPTASPVRTRADQPFVLRYTPADAYEPSFYDFKTVRTEDGVIELTAWRDLGGTFRDITADHVLVTEPLACPDFAACQVFCSTPANPGPSVRVEFTP